MLPTGNSQEPYLKNGEEIIGVAIPQVPVTEERLPFTQTDDHGYLQQAGEWCFTKLKSDFNDNLKESPEQILQQVLKHRMEQRRVIGQAGIRIRRYAPSRYIMLNLLSHKCR